MDSDSGYGKAPWVFKGSALYQLHLVKSKTVRACIPKELKLVEAFGYTLGGFFLANYDQSPAGAFDELVVIGGLVWNPPTSCAWATKVLVNSHHACKHGQKEVGLPSQFARFSKTKTTVQVREQGLHGCSFDITTLVPTTTKLHKWMGVGAGPPISLSLPSFSGRTLHSPDLLNYSCNIHCRVQAVHPAQVSTSPPLDELDLNNFNLNQAVMLSKPIFALKFSCMTMQVGAPLVIPSSSKTSLSTC